MEYPSIRQRSAAWPRRVPLHDGHTRGRGFGSMAASSATAPTVRPSPAHSGQRPWGSLNENRRGGPTCGRPTREKRSRSTGAMSVTVPTVECEAPPRRLWSTMTAMPRCSIASASGCG